MPDQVAFSINEGRDVFFPDLNRGDGSRAVAVAIERSSASVSLAGRSLRVSASVTRPNDTTAYATGEVINSSPASLLTFTAGRINGGTGTILGVVIVDSGNKATKPILELWLFKTAPVADNDNALFTPTDAELENLVGVFPVYTGFIGDATADTGNCVFIADMQPLAYQCDPASTSLFGVLVVRNAYTPIAQEKFTVILTVAQD